MNILRIKIEVQNLSKNQDFDEQQRKILLSEYGLPNTSKILHITFNLKGSGEIFNTPILPFTIADLKNMVTQKMWHKFTRKVANGSKNYLFDVPINDENRNVLKQKFIVGDLTEFI